MIADLDLHQGISGFTIGAGSENTSNGTFRIEKPLVAQDGPGAGIVKPH
jgi:hypothetical protein